LTGVAPFLDGACRHDALRPPSFFDWDENRSLLGGREMISCGQHLKLWFERMALNAWLEAAGDGLRRACFP